MLPKNYRLRLKKDFDRIFKEGRFVGGGFFTLGYMKNDLAFSRFAVVVPKKVSNKAVKRNTVKRRTVEVIRLMRESIKQGFDLVFIAKPGANSKLYKEIEEEAVKLLKRSRLVA